EAAVPARKLRRLTGWWAGLFMGVSLLMSRDSESLARSAGNAACNAGHAGKRDRQPEAGHSRGLEPGEKAMAEVRLTEVDGAEFGGPDVTAETGAAELGARLDAVRAAMAVRGLDRLFVYGDREHAANIHWLTGFDPRFEEAFLVVGPEGPAVLAAGNECLP